jgi:peptidoglycan-N-acetylglucosamine deacetylase
VLPPAARQTKTTIYREAIRQNYPAVQWTVDSRDWTGLDSGQIVERVVDAVEPGSIVLMHDAAARKATADALPTILDTLEARGYEFVTVPEMLRRWDAAATQREFQKATAKRR